MGNASGLDAATLALVELAAAIAVGRDEHLRRGARGALAALVPSSWVEELVLQSVLMVGWPRTLIAAAVWREESGLSAPPEDHEADHANAAEWAARGETTCRKIYGINYDQLRTNVRTLHPALDQWMVTEGYGRTLSRPGLDLRRRELCTVTQCAVQGAMPQLHSHLRGAQHAGANADELRAAIDAAGPFMEPEIRGATVLLLERVVG